MNTAALNAILITWARATKQFTPGTVQFDTTRHFAEPLWNSLIATRR